MTNALAVLASLTAVGFGFGIVVAGPIVDVLGYHWLFWLPMVATAVAAVGALRFIPESPRGAPERLPLVPAAAPRHLAGHAAAPGEPGQRVGLGLARACSGLLAVSAA